MKNPMSVPCARLIAVVVQTVSLHFPVTIPQGGKQIMPATRWGMLGTGTPGGEISS
jgi:hypothetical protein